MLDSLRKAVVWSFLGVVVGVFLGKEASATPIRQLHSIESLRNQFQGAKLKFKEQGLLYGHFSIQSCIYADSDLMVINNYCFPKKKYVAEAYTFISRERGIIEFYREDEGALWVREITQKVFPSLLAKYMPQDFRDYTLNDLNHILEKINDLYEPGCWSTNWDYETEAPKAACNKGDIQGFPEWRTETQNYVNDEKTWEIWFEEIRLKLEAVNL